jgi:hypothetical protein
MQKYAETRKPLFTPTEYSLLFRRIPRFRDSAHTSETGKCRIALWASNKVSDICQGLEMDSPRATRAPRPIPRWQVLVVPYKGQMQQNEQFSRPADL